MSVKYFKKTADGAIQTPTLKTYKDLYVEDTADIKTLVVDGNNTVSNHISSGELNENLIYPVIQYTADMSESAFDGTFYEVASFITSEQIPSDAKLIYLEDDVLKFCSTLPPNSGTKYGTAEQVEANKTWFESIIWLKVDSDEKTTTVTTLDPTTGTITETSVDGSTVYNSYGVIKLTDIAYDETATYIQCDGMDKTEILWEVGKHSIQYTFGDDYTSQTNIEIIRVSPDLADSTKDYWEIYYTATYLAEQPREITNIVISYNSKVTAEIDLADFSYTTPSIKIGSTREVATQSVQAFVDYRQNAINEALDLRSAKNILSINAIPRVSVHNVSIEGEIKGSSQIYSWYWQTTVFIPNDYNFGTHYGNTAITSFSELVNYLLNKKTRITVIGHSSTEILEGLVEIFGGSDGTTLYCGVIPTASLNTPSIATWDSNYSALYGLTVDVVNNNTIIRDYVTEI